MGVEWSDLLPDRAGTAFPQDIIESAMKNKTNFIWWIRTNRTSEGGYNFHTQALPYLKANPLAGITTSCPDNIDCAGATANLNLKVESFKIMPNPVKNILQIDGDIQNADVSIVHINGSIYYNQNQVNEKLMVNVESFPSGMYFIKIGKNQRTIVRKFIKV